jgi:hypothetical protein
MKPNSDPFEPFREMLTDDDTQLPAMAAQAAREFRDRRDRNRRRIGQAALVALLFVCCWQTSNRIRSVPKGGNLAQNVIQQSALAQPRGFVRVQNVEEAISKPLPPPQGATQDQKALLDSALGQPLLVVLDNSGKPAQIVVLER